MKDLFPTLWGTLELLVFFIFDFIYANALAEHKKEYAELEEGVPYSSPDLDTAAVFDQLATTAVNVYNHQRSHLFGSSTPYDNAHMNSNNATYSRSGVSDISHSYAKPSEQHYENVNKTDSSSNGLLLKEYNPSSTNYNQTPLGALTSHNVEVNNVAPNAQENNDNASISPSSSSFQSLHFLVVICGILAPLLVVLQLLFPLKMGWAHIGMPSLIAYSCDIIGLSAVGLYAVRSTHLSRLPEVTKTQWISMMWFRLDFMFIMAMVGLFGAGLWLVSLCMTAMAAYLAHRVMKMEKYLQRMQSQTQLVRGEVMNVDRVLKPGSEESKKAVNAHSGYNAATSTAPTAVDANIPVREV